ncbi:MAG: hypothetical protein C4532_12655 [Candidatus Abyssobacteria bacterium SURF_17]|jgi:hypothetical protein|uniref:Uncharacterized protein n=1 Tax=Candidatus Abyssobacteria bacterium SURF_17 TaxID=2093361 RepID=A0A419EVM3_9BACT|nr:MAG: hypothetical protein C4532_12655 [Candidatus Abyssubacteria bacterium SURF_17]
MAKMKTENARTKESGQKEEEEMRTKVIAVALALVLSAAMVSNAYAKDEFEKGFKTELGAIAARSAVGLGVTVVNGVFGGGIQYNGFYGKVAPRRHTPHYAQQTVVYAPPPPPVYVEQRVYYYPPPPPPPPPVHCEYHYYYAR